MTPPLPRLIVITDWRLPPQRLRWALSQALDAGPQVALQHRHPEATGRRFFEEARELAALCQQRGNPLFVNGRFDVALRVGAHVHLPAHGPTPEEVRPHLPSGTWISAAVHDVSEAHAARGADLALVSPVFSPGSKPGDTRPPLGPTGFSTLAAALGCPALALGGITPARAAELPGAAGSAVISSVLEADDPRAAALSLLAACAGRAMLRAP
ncbi:thiamine phosphate synthase [Corallococcus macrosporus]|uniref:Thiamine phosphate synthase n=1 Tax=Corallococcus macrosporus DSM 14697 TaxID=1189310 RepID=A0A250JUP5_9BACT|nr:thiamine phosphate synthase [Corallococcus macrosporus]ATB47609.1 thiamine phosphate synthase [Corallococcus macrosporus DSM 14697]